MYEILTREERHKDVIGKNKTLSGPSRTIIFQPVTSLLILMNGQFFASISTSNRTIT